MKHKLTLDNMSVESFEANTYPEDFTENTSMGKDCPTGFNDWTKCALHDTCYNCPTGGPCPPEQY